MPILLPFAAVDALILKNFPMPNSVMLIHRHDIINNGKSGNEHYARDERNRIKRTNRARTTKKQKNFADRYCRFASVGLLFYVVYRFFVRWIARAEMQKCDTHQQLAIFWIFHNV